MASSHFCTPAVRPCPRADCAPSRPKLRHSGGTPIEKSPDATGWANCIAASSLVPGCGGLLRLISTATTTTAVRMPMTPSTASSVADGRPPDLPWASWSICSITLRVNPGPARTLRYSRPLSRSSRAWSSAWYSSAAPPGRMPLEARSFASASCHWGLPGPARSASVSSLSIWSDSNCAVSASAIRLLIRGGFLRPAALRPADHASEALEPVEHPGPQRHRLGAGDLFHLRVGQVLEDAQDDDFLLVRRQAVQGLEHPGNFFLLFDVVGGALGDLVRVAAHFHAFEVQLGHVAHRAALAAARVVDR